MPRPRAAVAATPAVQVRRGLGLSQWQLAAWLGVTAGFTHALESGRKPLPLALAERLLMLAWLLPPPLGSGPPVARSMLPSAPWRLTVRAAAHHAEADALEQVSQV